MKNVIVIAPHPDDETLGCGGALLRHQHEGDSLHWVIATSMHEEHGATAERIEHRRAEIEAVARAYGFASVHRLDFPTTRLDTIPAGDLVATLKTVFDAVSPEVVYAPYPGDVHTDHRIVFDTVAACSKWFRQSTVRRILAYETLSETEFGIRPDTAGFRPNVFINISEHLEQKLAILDLYAGETGTFPFPRSVEAVRALAALRGAAAGYTAAEAFMLLKEMI